MSVEGTGKQIVIHNSANTKSKPPFVLNSKCYRIGIALLCGINGGFLLNFGLQRYWEAKTLGSMVATGTGGVFVGGFIAISIYECFCGNKSTPTFRQTGASLLKDVRKDGKTISGACAILGIPNDQIHNKEFIEFRKNKMLEEHTKNLNKALKVYSNLPKDYPEPAPAQAFRLMIEDVNTAYETLSRYSPNAS